MSGYKPTVLYQIELHVDCITYQKTFGVWWLEHKKWANFASRSSAFASTHLPKIPRHQILKNAKLQIDLHKVKEAWEPEQKAYVILPTRPTA